MNSHIPDVLRFLPFVREGSFPKFVADRRFLCREINSLAGHFNHVFSRMPTYRARTRARTRQFFAFPPFSPPASHMTIKRRVFLAIMEGELELGLAIGFGLGLGLCYGYG